MITLHVMNYDEFQKYITVAIEEYAKEKVISGNWSEEESMSRSKEEFEHLLPNGVKTENHYLYSIYLDNQSIGIIWIARKTSEEGFIYDFSILEKYRGQGYGEKAMKQIEVEAKNLGMKKIGLHVFGHNHIARALYEKIGFQPTNIVMQKEI